MRELSLAIVVVEERRYWLGQPRYVARLFLIMRKLSIPRRAPHRQQLLIWLEGPQSGLPTLSKLLHRLFSLYLGHLSQRCRRLRQVRSFAYQAVQRLLVLLPLCAILTDKASRPFRLRMRLLALLRNCHMTGDKANLLVSQTK